VARTGRTAKASTVISLVFGLWALAIAIGPFFPTAVAVAAVGFGCGLIGRRAGSADRWGHAATVGLAVNALAVAIVVLITLAVVV